MGPVVSAAGAAGTTGQRGQATAELAVAIIALVAAMVPLLSGVHVVMTAARAQEGARAIAREVARGESADAATTRVTAGLPGSAVRIESVAGDAVVTVTVPVSLPFGTSLDVTRTAHTVTEQS